MAASMYIVVEGEDPGFDIFVNGRALARHEDALERLALRLRVRPLIEFFSADENSMAPYGSSIGRGGRALPIGVPLTAWVEAGIGVPVSSAFGDFVRTPTLVMSFALPSSARANSVYVVVPMRILPLYAPELRAVRASDPACFRPTLAGS